MSKPEDISVILGRIRTVAEELTEYGNSPHVISSGMRISELLDLAQKEVLQSQLEASLKAVKP